MTDLNNTAPVIDIPSDIITDAPLTTDYPMTTDAPVVAPTVENTNMFQMFKVTCQFDDGNGPVEKYGIFQTWTDSLSNQKKSTEPAYILFEPTDSGLEEFISKIRSIYAAGAANPKIFRAGIVSSPFRRRSYKEVK